MGGSCLIIPHVSTVAEAAANVVVNPFETMEFAVGSPEAGG
jgi:hypothetical protein